MPLTIQTIEELEEHNKRALPGPWYRKGFLIEETGERKHTIIDAGSRLIAQTFIAAADIEWPDPDGILICHMRNKLPDLLSAAKWALLNGFKQE